MAEQFGLHRSTVGAWHTGRCTVPLSRAVQLAEFFGVSIDYLAGRTNVREMAP